ncbi:TolB family protein [Streptomyces albus]|uniref:TolB family protein n=1 Tax=Streptomyces albus TaxID=1888 RepID=UPI003F19A07A
MRGNTERRRGPRRPRSLLSAAVAACAVTMALPAAAAAEPGAARGGGAGVERVSVASDGTQGDGDSTGATITDDGQRIAFRSLANNLTSANAAYYNRVFVRDQRTSLTTMMNASNKSPNERPVISGDGQYVGFWADFQKYTKTHLSVVSSGLTMTIGCAGLSCRQPSLSTNGRYVAHTATFGQLPTRQRIEIQDWQANTSQYVTEFAHTAPARPSISGDGRFVAYQDGQEQDVYVYDRTDDTSAGPIEGAGKAATLVQLSRNGEKIVYLSGDDTHVQEESTGAEQVVPNARGLAIDPSGRYLLYAPVDPGGPSLVLRDLRTGTDETVTDRPATAGTDSVSAGGRDVVFSSTADDIVPGDTNGKSDVFVRRFY